MWICAEVTAQVVVLAGHRLVDQVGERAGQLDAGRAAADDDEVERARVDQRRVAVGLLEDAEDARAQPLRVVEGVERERVLLGPRRVEEVRLRAGREHERVALDALAVRGRHRVAPPGRSTRPAASLTSTFSSSRNSLRSEIRDVARGELGRRHLVQQRLELVVVVAVDQRDAHVVAAAPAAARTRARRSRRRRRRRGAGPLVAAGPSARGRGRACAAVASRAIDVFSTSTFSSSAKSFRSEYAMSLEREVATW